MIRAALALLSTLQIGARLKGSLERSLRQAVIIAVAVVLLIAAAAFGLRRGRDAHDRGLENEELKRIRELLKQNR